MAYKHIYLQGQKHHKVDQDKHVITHKPQDHGFQPNTSTISYPSTKPNAVSTCMHTQAHVCIVNLDCVHCYSITPLDPINPRHVSTHPKA